MLYHIVTAAGGKDHDDSFKKHIEYIKHFYFPVKTQEQRAIIQREYGANIPPFLNTYYISYIQNPSTDDYLKLKDWGVQATEKEIIDDNNIKINQIKEDICKNNRDFGYPITDQNGDIRELLKFPFIDRFHEYFLRRQWDYPERHTRIVGTDGLCNLFRLYPHNPSPNAAREGEGNYSKTHGDYNHFVNVVAALARLIDYFKDVKNVQKLLGCSSNIDHRKAKNTVYETIKRQEELTEKENQLRERQEQLTKWAENIAYEAIPNMRTFKLMLAAFYHDLGKTVANPRHGMEGSLILEFHSSQSPYQLNQIVQESRIDEEFGRDDLLFIAEFLKYHDKYGTLSTGEDGYLQLIEIIDSIKRYSIKHETSNPNDRSEQIKWSQRYLFDLWLLNLADIIVSMKNKWKLQDGGRGEQHTDEPNWMDYNNARTYINNFLGLNPLVGHEQFHSDDLKHDLLISLDLLEEHNKHKHTDNTSALKTKALDYAKRHSVERIRRLIVASLRRPIDQYRNEAVLERLIDNLKSLSEKQWNSRIANSIKTISDLQEFCDRLAWIGKMDYSLGFFIEIATRAFLKVKDELTTDSLQTHWLTSRDADSFGGDDNYLAKVQAQFFADNYVAIVVQILSYLLFREPYSEHFRNIEFSDATKRLTEEKMDKIIDIEGPYRSKKSIELILQTVTMY
jgi:hypothetical protein